MKRIDPSAVIGPQVQLADDVQIGRGCQLDGRISLGPGTVLMGYNYLRGPLTIGAGNRFYPFACIGFEPQDYKFDLATDGAGTVIGDHNIFREHVTIHRATSNTVPTKIGSSSMFMVAAHVGHDATVGSHCTFANNAMIAGHAVLYDRVNIGGAGGVGQKVAVGRLAFISATVGVVLNVPPFMVARSQRTVGGLNIVGLRRSGMPRSEVDQVKWIFRTLYLMRNTRPTALEALESRAADSPVVAETLDFLRRHPGPLAGLEAGKESREMLDADRTAEIAD